MAIKGITAVRSLYKTYKKNELATKLLSVLSIDVLTKASGILLLPIYLQLMTQEEYGIFNYVLSFITTFSLILNFGLYVSQSKYYTDANGPGQKGQVIFNIFALFSGLLILSLVLSYLFQWDYMLIRLLFKNEINYPLYRIPILLALVVSAYTVLISNYFITSEQLRTFQKFNITRLIVVNTVVLATLYFSDKDTVFLRLAYTYSAELMVLILFSIPYVREMRLRWNKKTIINSLKLGFPIMFSAIWGLFANYSDKFFLEKYGSQKDLSYYYLAFSISNILYMVCAAMQNIWLPIFLKEKELSRKIAITKKLFLQAAIGLSALSVFISIGFYFAIKFNIISTGYLPASYILPILLLSQVVSGLTMICSNYMIFFEKTRWVLFIGITCSVIGLLGGYFIVPIWNIFGASIVYFIVQLAYLVIYYFVIRLNIRKYYAATNVAISTQLS
ncbi:MAG: lipopolysaccharide biosynthesis protein [Chitinophagaceae bacterium]